MLYKELSKVQYREKLIYKYLSQFLDKMNYHYGWNGVLKLTYIDYVNMQNLMKEKNVEIKKAKEILKKIYS